jgi:hypothetical protein
MAYDSLVEKTNKEKKTKFFMGSLPCDFALGCVCAIAFLGSWQSFFQNDKTECVFSGFSTLQICPPPWSCVVELVFFKMVNCSKILTWKSSTNDFSWKKTAQKFNSPDFERKTFQIAKFIYLISSSR